ncbi:hypothetical protein [Paenibacillus sp. IHBB 10380]|uniref:hypothetical protein n=1 Tax=Paenibacillus sp. IHBB 10380 TaxID=1566358 RepID=UPI0005CFCFC3|nr:hypothetical protein [Paenibacillus sp. IHBB 10380]AJS59220.1 hypothetical protein UB51_12920 [Paenibacillus sp. IHBB 10380]
MNCVHLLQKVREVCLEHYDELKLPKSNAIDFCSKTLSSKVINGGAGDRDVDQYVGIQPSGWVMYEIETEISGIGGPTKSNTLSKSSISDQELENYFNGQLSSIGEVADFIKKYNEIADMPNVNLTKIDFFLTH